MKISAWNQALYRKDSPKHLHFIYILNWWIVLKWIIVLICCMCNVLIQRGWRQTRPPACITYDIQPIHMGPPETSMRHHGSSTQPNVNRFHRWFQFTQFTPFVVVTNIDQLLFMRNQQRWKPNIIYTQKKSMHSFISSVNII